MRKANNDDAGGFDTEEFKQFQSRWLKTLDTERLVWEGRQAMRELKSQKIDNISASEFLHKQSRWQAKEVLSTIFAAVNRYKKERDLFQGIGATFASEFKEVRQLLIRLRQELTKTKKQVHYEELRIYLEGLEKRLRDELRELQRAKRWKKLHSRSPLGVYEGLYPDHATKRLVQKGIDLDTNLQKQMAKMFMAFLEEFSITRWTVARLIVLTYLVAGLGKEDPDTGDIKMHKTNRTITVRSVYDKIGRL